MLFAIGRLIVCTRVIVHEHVPYRWSANGIDVIVSGHITRNMKAKMNELLVGVLVWCMSCLYLHAIRNNAVHRSCPYDHSSSCSVSFVRHWDWSDPSCTHHTEHESKMNRMVDQLHVQRMSCLYLQLIHNDEVGGWCTCDYRSVSLVLFIRNWNLHDRTWSHHTEQESMMNELHVCVHVLCMSCWYLQINHNNVIHRSCPYHYSLSCLVLSICHWNWSDHACTHHTEHESMMNKMIMSMHVRCMLCLYLLVNHNNGVGRWCTCDYSLVCSVLFICQWN